MTQTFETTIPELLKKWNLGEIDIPEDTKISVSYEDEEMLRERRKKEGIAFLLDRINNPLTDPDEIEEAERDLKEFQNRLNQNRLELGDRPLFPE
jgi:hypothetical protein